MASVVLQGNTRRIRARFYDLDGNLFDGNTVKLLIQNGLGAKTLLQYGVDAAIIRNSVGEYTYAAVLNNAGTWAFYWYSEGTIAASGKHFITVEAIPSP